MAQSIEEFFIASLQKIGQKNGVCAKFDDDVFVFKKELHHHTHKYSLWGNTSSSNHSIKDFQSLAKDSHCVSAVDGFCEDIHFKRKWFSPYMLACKAFLVNISDFIAKNATPAFALISLVIAKDMNKSQITQIVNGFSDVCKNFHIRIIGGDTMLGEKLAFHITLFGFSNKPISRHSQSGSLLFCTQGDFGIGFSLKTLRDLLRFKPMQKNLSNLTTQVLKNQRKSLHNRFYLPLPRICFMQSFGRYIRSSMDISDGLLQDIPKLLSHSNLNLIPSQTFKRLQNGGQKWRIQSGEEYEILFCIHAKHRHALKRITRKTRTKILFLGKLKRGKCRLHSQKWH